MEHISSKYEANLKRSSGRVLDLKKCLDLQMKQISDAADKLLEDHRAGKNVTDGIAFWRTRLASLKSYHDGINTELDTQRKLMAREHTRIQQEERGRYEKLRGLTSYALATGQGSPELKLLHDAIGDVLDATADDAREEAKKTVDLVLQFAKFGDERQVDSTPVLNEYESIADPAYATTFFKQNEAEIQRQFQMRLDHETNLKGGKNND